MVSGQLLTIDIYERRLVRLVPVLHRTCAYATNSLTKDPPSSKSCILLTIHFCWLHLVITLTCLLQAIAILRELEVRDSRRGVLY